MLCCASPLYTSTHAQRSNTRSHTHSLRRVGGSFVLSSKLPVAQSALNRALSLGFRSLKYINQNDSLASIQIYSHIHESLLSRVDKSVLLTLELELAMTMHQEHPLDVSVCAAAAMH